MNRFTGAIFGALMLLCGAASSQTNQPVPELVFQNPVLVAGTAGADGAVYSFAEVTKGVDARIKVLGRSAANVVLTDIDVADMGWTKAFQPQLGIPGNVPANATWWMQFEVVFYRAGTNTLQKLNRFNVTSIDVDGDGLSIQEFIQPENISAISYSPNSLLQEGALLGPLAGNTPSSAGPDNDGGTTMNKLVSGPVQSVAGMDTISTQVMTTYEYKGRSAIRFTIGGKSGNSVSGGGERLNALWFRSFNLNMLSSLPVRMGAFKAEAVTGGARLTWTTEYEADFSHFVVERSTDGKSFSEAALVIAHGNSNGQKAYAYTDKALVSGVAYYRLRLVEKTGEADYSQVRAVRNGSVRETLALNAYPNPAVRDLKVELPAAWSGKPVSLELINGNGLRVQRKTTTGTTVQLDLSALPRGIYLLKAVQDTGTLTQRIVKE